MEVKCGSKEKRIKPVKAIWPECFHLLAPEHSIIIYKYFKNTFIIPLLA